MRDIEFRGWDIERKQWVYGYYEKIPVGVGQPRELIHVFNDWGLSSARKIAPNSAGQYTGFLDKNNKKVYEGDIVRGQIWNWHEPRELVVEWSSDSYEHGYQPFVELHPTAEGDERLYPFMCEVIGNTYE